MARILIVDDEDAFRNALSESIRDLGHQAIEASRAGEALERIHDADVTFLDLRMPGMSGIDFLRESKPPTPVIVLTAFADSSNTIEAIKLGAFDHLTKPVGREDLKRVLTEALKRPQITETSGATAAGDLIGFSTGMREVQKRIGVAASGNITVRELQNVMHSAPLATRGNIIDAAAIFYEAWYEKKSSGMLGRSPRISLP